MEEAKDIWMPFYIGDYLSDTQLLTTEQHGAYFLLIIAYWKNQGPLPDNNEILASVARLPPAKWKRIRSVVGRFFLISEGMWIHKRINKELKKSKELRNSASKKSSKAAKVRWEKERKRKESDAPSNAPSNASSMPQALPQAMPQHMPEQCQSQSQSHTQPDSHSKPIGPAQKPHPRDESNGRYVDTETGEIYAGLGGSR